MKTSFVFATFVRQNPSIMNESNLIVFTEEDNRYIPGVQLYNKCMNGIKFRLSTIKTYLEKPERPLHPIPETEFICQQFRCIFEMIILSGLVSNRYQFNLTVEKLQNHYILKNVIEKIEKFNDDFYPKPVTMNIDQKSFDYILDKQFLYMTKGALLFCYVKCHEFIHVKHPYAHEPDYNAVRNLFVRWWQMIKNLINTHVVKIEKDSRLIFAALNIDNGDNVVTTFFKKKSVH